MTGADRYRTTRDIVVPKGANVIFVKHMKQDIFRAAMALVRLDPDNVFEWQMDFESAMKLGLIEKIRDA